MSEQSATTKLFELIKNLNAAEYMREEELGTKLSFASARPLLDLATEIATQVRKFDIDSMPATQINKLATAGNVFMVSLSKMKSFNAQQSNPIGERNQLLAECGNMLSTLFETAAPYIALGALRSTAAVELADLVATKTTELNDLAATATSAIAEVRAAATKRGISEEGKFFSGEAFKYSIAAWCWLVLSFILAGSVVGFAFHFYKQPETVATTDPAWEFAQRVGAKLIFISVLTFLLVFTVRNYSTCRHNVVINRHRAVSLTTYDKFMAGAASDKTKDMILRVAVRSVYAQQSSGYLRKTDSTLPVADLLRVLGPK